MTEPERPHRIRVPAIDDTYLEQMFARHQRPMHWFATARDLAEVAEIVFRSQARVEKAFMTGRGKRRRILPGVYVPLNRGPNYYPGHLMYALAIENAIKGIAIGRNTKLIGKHKLDPQIANPKHSLVELCGVAGIELSDADKRLLRRLTHTIRWAGRYPTPRHFSDIMPKDGTGRRYSAQFWQWWQDHDAMRDLFKRLDTILGGLLDDGLGEDTVVVETMA